ncbi:MAG: hypothetical protein KF865_14375 [Bdellovibrionaceae bacterium]|nr:hypothetical protein [Pseudobdellovibrionaceae bacterium]
MKNPSWIFPFGLRVEIASCDFDGTPLRSQSRAKAELAASPLSPQTQAFPFSMTLSHWRFLIRKIFCVDVLDGLVEKALGFCRARGIPVMGV